MTKTTTPKPATTAPKAATPKPETTGPNRADAFKVIAGRIRLIGKRRSPALRAVYNEAAQIIERAAKES